MHTTYTSCTWW